jgi:cytochrome c556
MKSKIAILVVVLAILGFMVEQSHTQPQVSTREMMRFKLFQAQGVLEGIATENYALIETNAGKLLAMSQAADWQVRQTPEYQRFTADFSRQAVALQNAARQKNVDAATVAYFQMTVSCVQCHKYLRGAREAEFEVPGRKIAAGN